MRDQPRLLVARGTALRFRRPLGDAPAGTFDVDRESDHGYTTSPASAMADETEAVSADDQRDLSADARQRARRRQALEWEQSRDRLQREISWLNSQRFRRDVRSDVRALERQVARLDKKIRGK